MIVLKIVGILLLTLLALFVLLLFIRVGILVRFGEETTAFLQIGLLRKQVFPLKKPLLVKKTAETAPQEQPPAKKPALPKPTFAELRGLVRELLPGLSKMLRRMRRRIRIYPLQVFVRFGGSDPAETAELYGYANALMQSLMPLARDTFYMPAPEVHFGLDFEAPDIRADGTVGVSCRPIDLLAIALAAAVPLMRWYLRFKRAHKQNVSKPAPGSEPAQAHNNSAA